MSVNPSDDGPRLPASIEAAWGRRERPTKGPKPGLSLERIVDAAVHVAATDGLSALSMSRVAAELGSSAMSLYRYVTAKDELLVLMVDAAIGPPPAAPQGGEDWRAGLSRWAWAYHDVLRRHNWVVRLPITAPSIAPNQTAWLEDGLRALGETGLGEAAKLSVMLLVSGFVRNDATVMTDIAEGAAGQEIMPSWAQLLARLTDAASFPALHAALASGAFDQDDDPDDEFVFGLERILDGVAALIAARVAGSGGQ